MTVKVLIGDLFASNAQTLVNTVNCVGVMGKGIALEFKNRFPEMYKDYVVRCQKQQVRLGEPYLFQQMFLPWILNFPTKDHWRSVANLDSIVTGLEYLVAHYKEWGIQSIAIPPLGAGQGQLEWRIIGPTLYRYLSQMDISVELYAPYGTPHGELQPEFLKNENDVNNSGMPEPNWIKPAWVALVEILKRIDEQAYHWPIGRTIFQKIAYVATEEGLPTGFNFQQGSYGPFSSEVKPAIARLVNNGLIQESSYKNILLVSVGRTYEDAWKAYSEDINQWNGLIDKVADLFLRLNTSEAEIVATVLYSARMLERTKQDMPTEQEVLDAVMKWKQRRKPPLAKESVADTIRNLAILDWIKVKASADLPLSQEYMLDF